MLQWRAMHAQDLPAAELLGSATHLHYPERPEIAAERLRLAPDWCFVLSDAQGVLCGYCVGHPWGGILPPKLDTLLERLPAAPDRVHLHDLVVAPSLRGQGFAKAMLDRFVALAASHDFSTVSLIAVGNADGFWRAHGFMPEHEPLSRDLVAASYGPASLPMRRQLRAPPAGSGRQPTPTASSG